jgi:hypothetical protein
MGDFQIGNAVYHVTAAPGQGVVRKAADNVKMGLRPILLVPETEKQRARVLADLENVGSSVTIIAIEDFVAVNIIELSSTNNSDFFDTLGKIVNEYNRRVFEAETDQSLKIEVV